MVSNDADNEEEEEGDENCDVSSSSCFNSPCMDVVALAFALLVLLLLLLLLLDCRWGDGVTKNGLLSFFFLPLP